MAKRRKRTTKLERLERTNSALTWALTKLAEKVQELELERTEMAASLNRLAEQGPRKEWSTAAPPALGFGTPKLEPVDELADPNALEDSEFAKLWDGGEGSR